MNNYAKRRWAIIWTTIILVGIAGYRLGYEFGHKDGFHAGVSHSINHIEKGLEKKESIQRL